MDNHPSKEEQRCLNELVDRLHRLDMLLFEQAHKAVQQFRSQPEYEKLSDEDRQSDRGLAIGERRLYFIVEWPFLLRRSSQKAKEIIEEEGIYQEVDEEEDEQDRDQEGDDGEDRDQEVDDKAAELADFCAAIEILSYCQKELETWEGASRNITYLYSFSRGSGARWHEWALWTRQVYSAAERVGDAGAASIRFLHRIGRSHAIDYTISRLGQVDELLDVLQIEAKKRISLRDALHDTVLAVDQMNLQGSATTNSTAIDVFKAHIRARRATANVRNDSTGALPALSVMDQSLKHDQSSEARNELAAKDWKPTIMAVTLVLTILSTCFFMRGWQLSGHETGKTSDADFWFLLQGSTVQVASIVPVVPGYLMRRVQNLQVRWWIWIFLCTSVVCAFLAPVLYPVIRTELSAMITYIGSAVLAFVILEAMFLPDPTQKLKAS